MKCRKALKTVKQEVEGLQITSWEAEHTFLPKKPEYEMCYNVIALASDAFSFPVDLLIHLMKTKNIMSSMCL